MTVEVSKIQRNTRRKWLVIVCLAATAAAGIFLWTNVFQYYLFPKRFGVVEQGLIYRSGQISAPLVKKVLAEHNIKTIVILTGEKPDDPDQRTENRAADEMNIKILRFPLSGNGTGDINEYARAVTAIVEAEKSNLPVLVHCAAGAQRTGGVIAIYRVLVQKIDPNIVEDEIEKYGCSIDDKPVLRSFLNDNMAELAMQLKESGVIEEIPSPLPQIPRD
ncbi:MAG: tyrosine-protein phosphatase [Planctomycetota bacterium]